MRIVEHEDCYTVEDVFPMHIKAGYTKPTIDGLDVLSDMSKLAAVLGHDIKTAYMDQIHSNIVKTIEKKGVHKGDGIFTKESNLVLVAKTADCLPVFVFDEATDSVGIIHLGWRSAQDDILGNIPFKCDNAKVVIGIGLRRCCFEVGEFLKYSRLSPFIERHDNHLYYDPVKLAQTDLIKNGLNMDHFYDINLCTRCATRSFHSYRRDKTNKRTLSFIMRV